MPLGLAIGQFLILASIAGFVYYAVNTEGMQSFEYLWGLSNGWLLLAVVIGLPEDSAQVGMPVVGKWLLGITRTVISPPVPRPDWDWFTDDVIGWAWWGIVALVGWWYLTKLWGLRLPKVTFAEPGRAGRAPAPAAGRRRRGGKAPNRTTAAETTRAA